MTSVDDFMASLSFYGVITTWTKEVNSHKTDVSVAENMVFLRVQNFYRTLSDPDHTFTNPSSKVSLISENFQL